MTAQKTSEYLKELTIARLLAMPSDTSVSIGDYGDYKPEELISEIQAGTDVGATAIDIELAFLRKMPKLAAELGRT